MPKVKLDATTCLTATCPADKSKETLWDTAIQGFVIEIRPNGGRTYYLRYFDGHGRQRQHKIGGFADLTFDQARKEARRLRSIVVLGGDPAAAKDERKATPSYAELASQHLDYAKTYQKRPGNTDAVLRVHILPRWGKLRLDEITTQDVAKWLAEKRSSGLAPATVEKIRIVFNRSFELGLKWGVAGLKGNPVRSIPRPKFNNARERYLSPAEAQRLLAAAGRSDNSLLAPIVALLLYTGARKNELLQAQWQHVDLERRSWFIPDSKTGKSRHVPLSKPACEIIERLERTSKWLLPNPHTQRPFTDIKHAWMTARDEAHLPGLRLHDLRHAAASAMVGAGIDLYAVGKILGHADQASSARYAHLANDRLRTAVEAGAANLNLAAVASG
ncbi:tyrosine-type recombinase/integrase [Altererythrobacter aerius]|uniref:Tyrosine-type recombinase/integrase n=1 Tax=Tsuneonella aeria TaxID=1837929 RepID=A0A6I4TDV6_9SPHN|nr:site-specific integrase [Tsuneonella aeria]MXO74837.1 tyrosine-type recombinase/integrase [Tsuneonella aeria]